MASSRTSPGFRNALGALKIVSIALGFVLTMAGLMAVVGGLTSRMWAQIVGALVVTVGLPALVVDRLLPDDPAQDTKGLPSDIFAVVWLVTGVAFVGLSHLGTGRILTREGDQLARAGSPTLARLCYAMAGIQRVPPPPTEPVKAVVAPRTQLVAGTSGTDASVATSHADAPTPNTVHVTTQSDAAVPPALSTSVEHTPSELFKVFAPAVVTITVALPTGTAGGTGFLLDSDGTIATNAHVVEGAEEIKVKFFNDTEVMDVELLDADTKADLALLRVKSVEHPTPVILGDSDSVVVGERVLAIGNPLGLEHTLTDGIISARRLMSEGPMIQVSVPVSPGNSGGPLFNLRGEVMGIVTAQFGSNLQRAENLNMAVPVNILKAMIHAEYPRRRRVGTGHLPAGRW